MYLIFSLPIGIDPGCLLLDSISCSLATLLDTLAMNSDIKIINLTSDAVNTSESKKPFSIRTNHNKFQNKFWLMLSNEQLEI